MSTPTATWSHAPSRRRVPHPQASTRGRVVGWVLLGTLVLVALLAMTRGDYPLSLGEVVDAIVVGSDEFQRTLVLQWRAPRVLGAVAFGAALGVAGALFQTVTRNPLGSPDVIGFTTGAFTGVLVGTLVLTDTFASRSVWALLGGLGTGIVVYLLAYRGGMQGFRLIIVGIGVTALLSSVNTWLLLRAQNEVAMSASIWAAGTLNLTSWSDTLPPLLLVLALAPVVALLAAPLRQLELGDDAARAHGTSVEPTRLAVLVVAIALTAAVTASAGPIAFIALSAPQIAHRLTRGGGLPLTASALTGALLLVVADQAAQFALPVDVPVGTVTVVIGGIYLIGLLIGQARRQG